MASEGDFLEYVYINMKEWTIWLKNERVRRNQSTGGPVHVETEASNEEEGGLEAPTEIQESGVRQQTHRNKEDLREIQPQL